MTIHARSVLFSLAFAATSLMPVHAQTKTLDEGSFKILVGGADVGTETFTIRQNGSGPDAVVIAKGQVVLLASKGGTEVHATVQLAGPTMRPSAYEMEIHGTDAQNIRATVRGSRVSARVMSAAGENQREYLVSDAAVLLDEGVAHQYYFLARRGAGTTSVPVVLPRQSRQVTASVTTRGNESLSIGGTSVSARHFVVQPQGGASVDVWADAQGRILKIEIPSRQYVAIRNALP